MLFFQFLDIPSPARYNSNMKSNLYSGARIPYAIKTLIYVRRVDTQFNPLHKHVEWEIILPIEGDVTHIINDRAVPLPPGKMLLSKPYDFHEIANNVDSEYRHYDLYLSSEHMKRICDFISPDIYSVMSQTERFPAIDIDEHFRFAVFDKIEELLSLQNVSPTSPYTLALYDALLFSVVTAFIREELRLEEGVPTWLTELLTTINSRAMMGRSIHEIVQTTFYTHGRLCTLFKKYMGCTLVEYVTTVRMEQAKNLLRNKELSILDICGKVGYDSLSHFIKLFRAHTGETPNQYRKNMLMM